MKDETGKRFSKLRAFAKDALTSQDYTYNDDEYYQEEDDSYDKAGSPFDDVSSKSTSYSSSHSQQSSYKSTSDSSSDNSYGFKSSSASGYSSYSEQSTGSNIYKMSSTKSKFRLSILRLEKLDDAVKVADEIMSGNTITLVDLRSVAKETVRRIIDFLDGVRYTCEAKMEIVADYTYVVVPKDVELSGDLFSQIDTRGLV